MNKKASPNIGAVIEIASNAVRMNISQYRKGEIALLEELEYPISLGKDAYNGGNVSFETLRSLAGILEKYKKVMDSYAVGKRMLISCSVLREAKNRAIVADQVKLQTGMSVEILEDNIEKAYLYYDVLENSGVKNSKTKGNKLIAYIGAGSLGFAVHDGSNVIHTRNLPVGSIKMHDTLSKLRAESDNFCEVVEEFLDTAIRSNSTSQFDIKDLCLSGGIIPLIGKITETAPVDGCYQIECDSIKKLYKDIRNMSVENVAVNYDIKENDAIFLYNTIFIINKLLQFVPKHKSISSVPVDIADIFVKQMLLPKNTKKYQEFLNAGTISCAKEIAKTWSYSSASSAFISDTACLIFDKLKKLHGLDSQLKKVLKTSAILYTCRSTMGSRNSFDSIFNIISNSDIFGLTNDEAKFCAFISASATTPGGVSGGLEENLEFLSLPIEGQIAISKLCAIFRLAVSLDKSEMQKLQNMKIMLGDDKLTIRAVASFDTTLERWSFEIASEFFRSIFGIYSELIIKSSFLS